MKSAPAQIVREYGPFPGVTDVHGVSHDGRRVWFATGDSLQSMDPASGKIVSIIKMTARAGTAYDGRHLYQLAGPSIQKVDRAAARSWPRCQRPPRAARAWPGPRARCGWRITASARSTRSTRPRARSCAPSPGPLRDRRHVDQRRPVARHLGKRRKRTAPRLARDRRSAGEPAHAAGRLRLRAGSGRRRVYCGGSTSGRIRAVRQPEPASESR